MISMKLKDAGKPCRDCNLFKECNAKGEKNRCGMWKALDKLMFQYQKMEYFIVIDPKRRKAYEKFKKHAEILIKEYEKITGRKWMFIKDPYPEWSKIEKIIEK